MNKYVLRKVEASERPKAFYSFTVKGTGEFPYDMLRYDGCWPSRSDDAAALYSTNRSVRPITLNSYNPPTEGRWASFGWVVQS